jgi:glycosyltransferase involved in cell wall biosynthesis
VNRSSAVGTVACVLTTYNYGQYLGQAIDSLLAQSRPIDQIIVVDDGSTDNSAAVAKSYGRRVQLLEQPNSGVVIARNNGAKMASSDYLFFLDADDRLRPTYVAKLLSAMASARQSEVAVAYCDFDYFGTDTGRVRACSWNAKKLLYRNYIIGAALMTKQAFDAVGGYSLELNQKVSFEDWDLWLSMLEAGYKGVYVPESLFEYRLHGHGRNGPALQRRSEMEQRLRRRHAELYSQPVNRLYLGLFGTASRLRNRWRPAPGTESI